MNRMKYKYSHKVNSVLKVNKKLQFQTDDEGLFQQDNKKLQYKTPKKLGQQFE